MLGLVGVMLIAGAHAAVVGLRYHVGSFGDDGHYLALARALAGGLGYVDTSQPGAPPEATVPPGYPALLAPLAALFPGALLPFRVLSAGCWLAVFPLTWHWLGLRRIGTGCRLAALLLLALSPLGATYATMVMAEMPFLVVLLVLLIAMHHWERQHRASTGWGWTALTALVALVYLKTAAAMFVPAVVVYLLLRRRWRHAAGAAAGAALALAPLLLSRVSAGTSVVGERYAGEYGDSYHGLRNALGRSLAALRDYLVQALPDTVAPIHISVLHGHGLVAGALVAAVHYSVAPVAIAGFVAWQVRRFDVTAAAVPLYLLETLPFPYINERRLVLLLPLVLVWYVGGVALVVRWITRSAWARPARSRPVLAGVAAALIAPVLVVQFGRDYLFPPGVDTSQPAGSAYLAIMQAAAGPGAVFASSYLWTTSTFTGHPTTRDVFDIDCQSMPTAQYEQAMRAALARDRVGFVLIGKLEQYLDGPCLLPVLDAAPQYAVRLYHQDVDQASVYELIGPGTPHPDTVDLTVGQPAQSLPGSVTVQFAQAALVAQVSVSAAGLPGGPYGPVRIEVQTPAGQWVQVSAAGGPVGPGVAGGPPFLLRELGRPLAATAVRVSVPGAGSPDVQDLHVLGTLVLTREQG